MHQSMSDYTLEIVTSGSIRVDHFQLYLAVILCINSNSLVQVSARTYNKLIQTFPDVVRNSVIY